MYREYMYSDYRSKALLITAGLMQCAVCVAAQPAHLDIKVPSRIENDLFGPVKSVTSDVSYNMSDERIREMKTYDEAGNLMAESNWDSEDTLTSIITNLYDESGCFHRQQVIRFREEAGTNNWEVILSPETRQIAMKNERSGEITLRTYSPGKYLVHYRQMDGAKKLIKASRTRRREDNRETDYTRFDKDNRPVFTYYYKWDDRGFIVQERVRYHQEKKDHLRVYDYLKVDEHGNWTQQLMTRYDVSGEEKTRVYDKLTVRTIEYYEDDPEEDGS